MSTCSVLMPRLRCPLPLGSGPRVLVYLAAILTRDRLGCSCDLLSRHEGASWDIGQQARVPPARNRHPAGSYGARKASSTDDRKWASGVSEPKHTLRRRTPAHPADRPHGQRAHQHPHLSGSWDTWTLIEHGTAPSKRTTVPSSRRVSWHCAQVDPRLLEAVLLR